MKLPISSCFMESYPGDSLKDLNSGILFPTGQPKPRLLTCFKNEGEIPFLHTVLLKPWTMMIFLLDSLSNVHTLPLSGYIK